MKNFLLATAAVVLAAPALAADLPVRAPAPAPVYAAPVFSWSGFYVGVNAGYAWGKARSTDLDFYNAGERFGSSPDGFMGGAQAGWNWQTGRFVFGLEGELGYLGLDGGAVQPSSPAGDTLTYVNKGIYGSVSGRLGYAFDRTLVYAKAGMVYAGGKAEVGDLCNVAPCGPALMYGSKRIGAGYLIGAGVEHAFDNNWSVKLEYAYLDFGKRTVSGVDTAGIVWNYKNDLHAHTVKVGLNYRFGGAARPVVARY